MVYTEKENFGKLGHLILNEGTAALKKQLHAEHPVLHQVLRNPRVRRILDGLPRGVLNKTQRQLLYPGNGKAVDPACFDISLLFVLLRNICSLKRPERGWDTLPPASDKSRAASIVTIKTVRNEVFAHAPRAEMTEVDFLKYWHLTSAAILNLGGDENELQRLKDEPFTKGQVDQVLEEMLEEMDGIKKEIKRNSGKIDGMDNKLEAIAANQKEIKEKFDAVLDQASVSAMVYSSQSSQIKPTLAWNNK